jgi:rubredoxin
MKGHFFAGSFGGDAAKIGDATRLECKICWYVYDPAQGDDYWQIPAATPFTRLPEHWTCPNCDGAKDGFMVLEDDADG